MDFFRETYERALARCIFFPVGGARADGKPANVNLGNLPRGAIRPGDFLSVGNSPSPSIRRVEDDDAPYSWLATDKEYGSGTNWAWMTPMALPRIGVHHLD